MCSSRLTTTLTCPAHSRRAPWQSATATAASSFSAFRPDPDGHPTAADSSEQRRHAWPVFVAHRRMSTAATAASAAAEANSRQRGSNPSAGGAADGRETGAQASKLGDAAASPLRSEGAGSAQAGTAAGSPARRSQPSARSGGQIGAASRDFVYEGPLAAPVRRLKARSLTCLPGSVTGKHERLSCQMLPRLATRSAGSRTAHLLLPVGSKWDGCSTDCQSDVACLAP